MSSDSLYEVLGVGKAASAAEIKNAYRKLAREFHADVNPGDQAAEDRFKQVSAAYEVLSNDEQRALYDEFGAEATRTGFDPETARAYARWQEQAAHGRPGGGRGVVFGEDVDLGDLFGDFFQGRSGGFARGQVGPRRGADVEAELTISLEEALTGTERGFRLTRPEAVNGQGVAERTVTIDVKVPAGIEDGQKLRLAGQGAAGYRGGPSGDLLVTIRLGKHARFRREGRDLHLELPVSVSEAMLGGVVDVQTLDGTLELKIPPRSNSGTRLRLRGKGLPGRGAPRGDLYVRLTVQVPDVDPDHPAARRAAEALDALYPGGVKSALR